MVVGRRYRHLSSLDIDLEIRGILGESEDLISLIVRYWDRHHQMYVADRVQAISIRKSDLWKWKQVD